MRIEVEDTDPRWLRREPPGDDGDDQTDKSRESRVSRLVDAMATKLAATEKGWVPYDGPQGGSGWRNIDSGEIVYQDDPPGEAVTAEDVAEAALDAGVPPEEIEDTIGDVAGLDTSANPVDEMMDEMSMGLADTHLEDALSNPSMAAVYRGRAEREAGDRHSEEYYSALRGVLETELSDETKRQLAAEVGTGEAFPPTDPSNTEGDTERARRALEYIDEADTSDIVGRAEKVLRDTIAQDASRAKHDEVVDRMVGHTDEYRDAEERTGDLSEGRAAYHTSASLAGSSDPLSYMYLADDTSSRTVSHESAHALADAFAYDYVSGGGISSKHPDEGLPDWDFGPDDPAARDSFANDHEHGRKRNYMLTDYPDWDERDPKKWHDYATRGEHVDPDDLDIGDRVALRAGAGDEGAAIEGSVVPETRPVDGAEDMEAGDTIEFHGAKDVGGRQWGFRGADFEEAEVDAVVPAGNYIVIAEEGTYPLPEGAIPDEYERRPGVHDVVVMDSDSALVTNDNGEPYAVRAGDISTVNGETNPVIRDHAGDEHSIDGAEGDLLRMADRDSRDWVDTRERNPGETWRGETVRVSFGASDDTTEGVVVDETSSQCTIAYHDGNGNYNEKTVNKSNAYNQHLEFAQDVEEFSHVTVDPDREPPGLREAQYETVDLNEAEVDWDTSIQYDSPGDRLDALDVGDLALVKGPGGDRHVVKVTDAFEPFGADPDEEALEIQGTVGTDSEAGTASEAAGEGGARGRMVIGEGDHSLMGISPQEEWVQDDTTETTGSVGIKSESVDIAGVDDLLDLPAPPDAGPHEDFRVEMPHPETGEVETFTGRVDYPSGTAILKMDDGLDRFGIDLEPDEPMPPIVTTGPDGGEAVASLSDIVAAETREEVTGGFAPESASELEPGMVAEVELPATRAGSPEDEARDGFDRRDDDPVNLHEAAAVALLSDPDDGEVQELYGRLRETDNHSEPALRDLMEEHGYEGREADQRAELLHDAIDDIPDYEPDVITEEIDTVDEDAGRFTTEIGSTHRVERLRKAARTDQGGAGPATPEEAVDNLMKEINKAWHRMVTAHERDGGPDNRLHIGGSYSETNAHETLAKTHEAMQSDSGSWDAVKVAEHHPGLFEAYTDVFEPSDANKRKVNEKFEENPYAFSFSETPFPEVGQAGDAA